MKVLERLRRLDDRVLGPADPGPAWPRLIGVAAWLTLVGLRTSFGGAADSEPWTMVLGIATGVVGLGWLVSATRAAFRRRVPGIPPYVAGLLWVAIGVIPLIDYEDQPAAYFVVHGALALLGLGIAVAGWRARAGRGSPSSVDLT